jgi:hypothetical protein
MMLTEVLIRSTRMTPWILVASYLPPYSMIISNMRIWRPHYVGLGGNVNEVKKMMGILRALTHLVSLSLRASYRCESLVSPSKL